MPQLITSYKLSGYRPILTTETENYKRYLQLKKTFEKNGIYRIFAEPQMDYLQGNSLWYTEWEGKAASLNQFSEAVQQKLLSKLKYIVDLLFEECKKYDASNSEHLNLIQTLEKCIEIPDFSCVYVITEPNGEIHFALTMWGFIVDAFDAKTGIIRKIIPENYSSLLIKAKYPDITPADNENIIVEYSGIIRELKTNGEGLISLEEILINSSVIIYQVGKNGKKINETHFNFNGQAEQEIIITGFFSMKFLVMDSLGNVKASEKFLAEFNGQKKEMISSSEGIFIIDEVELKSKVIIKHFLNPESEAQTSYEFTCDKTKDTYSITLPIPEIPLENYLMNFKLIDHKKKAVAGQEIVFEHSGEKIIRTTDQEGKCNIDNVPGSTIVQASIKINKKTHIKRVQCSKNITEYLLVLEKRKLFWLWFLLLLLPLLLLIPLKKNISFKVADINNGKTVSGATVDFSYNKHCLFDFDSLKFLSNNKLFNKQTTDTAGIATFNDISYNVFQWMVYGSEKTLVTVESPCFSADSLHPSFSSLEEKPPMLIQVKQLTLDLNFLVLNVDNSEEIPGALVQIVYETNKVIQSDTSAVNGTVIFKDVPLCFDIMVIGSCYGYFNDTIIAKASEIQDYLSQRTLKLKPITKSVTFYIKNLKTKEPLPGASCKLIMDGVTVQETVSNTNGAVSLIGEATFEKVHIIKTITVFASKINFHDTSKTAKAHVFLESDREFCTLYLRPEEKSCDFRVVDAATNDPISGATAIITIKGGKTITETSNINGVIQIGALTADDIISITASKSPDYFPNDYTIKEKLVSTLLAGAQSDRDIPLKPEKKPEPPQPCIESVLSGGKNGAINEYNMGDKKLVFIVKYEMFDEADEMIIYCGRRNELEVELWSTGGKVKGNGEKTIDMSNCGGSAWITVKINPGGSNTEWNYNFICP